SSLPHHHTNCDMPARSRLLLSLALAPQPIATLFPYTTLFRSEVRGVAAGAVMRPLGTAGALSADRVLWVPYAQRGSIYPVEPLVQELRRRGKEILLLGPDGLKPLAKTLGVGFQPYASDISYD